MHTIKQWNETKEWFVGFEKELRERRDFELGLIPSFIREILGE
jgi:hypothetical protein